MCTQGGKKFCLEYREILRAAGATLLNHLPAKPSMWFAVVCENENDINERWMKPVSWVWGHIFTRTPASPGKPYVLTLQDISQSLKGRCIRVWWEHHKEWFTGLVTADDGERIRVYYSDNDERDHEKSEEWCLVDPTEETINSPSKSHSLLGRNKKQPGSLSQQHKHSTKQEVSSEDEGSSEDEEPVKRAGARRPASKVKSRGDSNYGMEGHCHPSEEGPGVNTTQEEDREECTRTKQAEDWRALVGENIQVLTMNQWHECEVIEWDDITRRLQVRYQDDSGEFIDVDSPRWRRPTPLCLSEMAIIADVPQLSAGTEIEVYWKPEKRFFPGTVHSFDVSHYMSLRLLV